MTYVNVSIPKVKTGAGAPKPKEPNVLMILAADVETMPARDGVVSTGDITLKAGKKAVAIYVTPKSINRFDSSDGETSREMGGFLSNFVCERPGDDEFFAGWLQEYLNEGFLILSKECGDQKGTRLQGTPCNPLYMTVEGQDNEEGIMSTLTFVSSQRSAHKMTHYRGTLPPVYEGPVIGGASGSGSGI
ncbi:hypothetical protein [Mongoliitalea lutea]|uniref:Uncharacterized protein n=1 Tax=Mongoliitalea lutea TaxID=849756 RepID=A0A8J3CXI5_9BACT|nr:hypothetical protein [Mongoliitalea lutea]GHB44469.1 hypothetical protein GCM10008106_26930 [Mongoliitalea lutea]